MGITQLTGPRLDEFKLFLDADPEGLNLETSILWLVEVLADLQSSPLTNQSQSQEVTTYTYNGLTGLVNITLAFQAESYPNNTGLTLKAGSIIG